MDRHILTALGFVLLLASCDELKEADLQPAILSLFLLL